MLKKLSFVLAMVSMGCFPYVYHQQDRVLIQGVDVGATLEIARIELEEGGFDATLTIWAIRDQVVSEDEAMAISELYCEYIDRIAAEKDRTTADFGVWHFTWAISNFYRNGNDRVKSALETAYIDAQQRPGTLKSFKDIAGDHVNGDKIVMGDIHGAARSYARSHVVVPGNKAYPQSLKEFKDKKYKKQ